MRALRITTLLILAGVFALPLTAPFIELALVPAAWDALAELPRLAELAFNSALLAGGTLLLVLPLGMAGAILLFRTHLPLASLWRFLSVLALFVPLPVVTSAWQMALGLLFHGPGGTPLWPQGFLTAIGLHAVVALPWIVVLIGLGLRWVEPELEEDALLTVSPLRVLLRVSLPRAFPAILLAALWTVLLTLNELTTVTDTLVIRTFGEEVYHQFTFDPEQGGPRALLVSLPALAVVVGLVLFVLSRWQRVVPPRQGLIQGPRIIELGKLRGLRGLLGAAAALATSSI